MYIQYDMLIRINNDNKLIANSISSKREQKLIMFNVGREV